MNKCGECTLCCDLFPVKWLNKPALTPCEHCVINKGCSIQDTKEDECKIFECAYYQMDKVHIDLRPDNCGIIFEKISEKIFYGTINPNGTVTNVAKAQMDSFNSQGYSVILYSFSESKKLILLAEGHVLEDIDIEFKKILNTYSKTLNGSTKLYN